MEAAAASARFEDHVGELELALEADTLEELFAEAARVVSRECGPAEGPPGAWETIRLSARDAETLLVDWLNELIGRSEVEQRAYGEVRAMMLTIHELPGRHSEGRGGAGSGGGGAGGSSGAVTAPVDRNSARLETEIRGRPVREWESALKAATYHGLRLERERGAWKARVLFDV